MTTQVPQQPEHLTLAGEFPAVEREQWRRSVEAVLRKSGALGEDGHPRAEDLLATTTYEGIAIQPLYTAEDPVPPAGLPGLAPFVRGSQPAGSALSGWDVRQRHADPDPAVTNREVLADLEHGAASVWLVTGESGLPVASLGDALNGVYLELAGVVLEPGAQFAESTRAYLELLRDNEVTPSEATGNLGLDPLGWQARTGSALDLDQAVRLAADCARSHPKLRALVADALPYHDAGGSDAEELGCSIAAGTAYLRALTEAGLDVDTACRLVEFRYAATADQFLTIAKLRAARRLWDRVSQVAGASPAHRAQHQHAVTSSAMLTRRDPWVNMLRTTLACFAAGTGGADAVTVLPFDAAIGLPDGFARRIARNTQALLLEESHLAQVIDPAGGSWYVESLTEQLARTAWSWFQEIERAGGLAAAQSSGLVADRLAATWQRRRDNIAHRRDAITGVSEFPHLAEKPVQRKPVPQAPGGGLPVLRYAQDFEELRDRSDAVLAETGHRPQLFLATLGPVAVHTGRSTFTANLFNAGGIETPAAGATAGAEEVVAAFTASGATIACLCSADKVYAERAAETIAALKAAGARRVLLAGSPKAWAEVGADGFVFAGCDALRTLTDTYRELGVSR
ncbi:methylmalonyl-CoA mutase small subunit [Kutzneria albida]|uniref:Methylmalonyl-CoA mutase small subunit n=1 Tax=Kutzneria albida DSM 43870 TaxID=1449976 RepID=W5W5R3_9PSEU|nr:methylmalonyl-CoA mutase small subunit [Kutzneria albida]AHH96227.1 Methylmalonyl-CoA mutase small subunit [Kutzneria albida DSM 43870]